MTAYAAVISLMHTILHLIRSHHIWVVPGPSQKIVQSTYRNLQSMLDVLLRLDSSRSRGMKRLNTLDAEIREVVYKFEDLLELFIYNQLLPQNEKRNGDDESQLPLVHIALQDLEQDIHSFTETLNSMKAAYITELDYSLSEDEDDDGDDVDKNAAPISTTFGLGGSEQTVDIIEEEGEGEGEGEGEEEGLISKIKHELWIVEHRSKESVSQGNVDIISLVGMAGIGKTTVIKEIFQGSFIRRYFNVRVWVTVGRKWQQKEILQAILAQLDPNEKFMGELEETAMYLKNKLKYCARLLVVLDDLWDIQVFLDLYVLLLESNRNVVFFVTTRLNEVAKFGTYAHTMQFLSKEASWDLLCNKVFGKELCPPQLEKFGKKIAEKCEGLPLTIVTVADLLSKAEKTPEFWSKVAQRKEHPIFIAAYEKISKVIYPSYEHLTQHLKMCFLYMGVFPQSYEIHKSKLIALWSAEGFFEQSIFQTSDDYVEKSLSDLVSNNIVMLTKKCFIWRNIKICKVHTAVWYPCNKVAGKNKFFHVLSDCVHEVEDCVKSQRRLCMHCNILLGIKKVHNLRDDNCASTLRSFLCFGPYHQYPVPICSGLRLLRVLDAVTIRFYEFPMEILQLVLLRYLALTCHGRLPSSIYKLSSLEFLIVSQHLSIKLYRALSPLPMEIWELKQLKHLQVAGRDLEDPIGTFVCPNFSTLLDVSPHSCTKSVFERVPNLKKLRIQTELAPDQAGDEPLCCFDNICHLKELESLKCVVVNPTFRPEVASPLVPLSIFSSSLKKFCLSGFGYPWEEMSRINASLPNLEVLKLVQNTFRGPVWEMEVHIFLKLKYLLIEDTDLVQWKVGTGSLPCLKLLSLRHCYKLKQIHGKFNDFIGKIEVVDCNPSVVTCLKQTALSETPRVRVHVDVHSSWLEDDSQLVKKGKQFINFS